MTELEELKKFGRESIMAKRQQLEQLSAELREKRMHSDTESYKILLDLLTHVRLIYELTVVEARATDSIDEIAKLWKDTYIFYSKIRWIADVFLSYDAKDLLGRYWEELVTKLESAARDQYEFHAK